MYVVSWVSPAPALHNEYIISKNWLIIQANLNLKGFLPPDELYKFELRENVMIFSRKCNLEWILTGANSEKWPAPAHAH